MLAYHWLLAPPDSAIRTIPPVDPLAALFVVPKLRSIRRELEEPLPRSQFTIHQAVVACALERYRIDHGAYPARLAEITQEHADVPNRIDLPP